MKICKISWRKNAWLTPSVINCSLKFCDDEVRLHSDCRFPDFQMFSTGDHKDINGTLQNVLENIYSSGNRIEMPKLTRMESIQIGAIQIKRLFNNHANSHI